MSEIDHFERILGLVCSVFDGYSSVLILPAEGADYEVSAYFSLGDSIQAGTRIGNGQRVLGWMMQNGKPVVINNFDREEGRPGYYSGRKHSAEIKSFMACPLSHAQGALCVDSTNPYAFSTKDQKLLHQFVQLVESFRKNQCQLDTERVEQSYYRCLQLIHGLREKNPRWSIFLKHLLEILSEYTNFSHCFMAARDERGQGYFLEGWNRPVLKKPEDEKRKLPIASGMVGWVFRNQAPLITNEGVPTGRGGSVFGNEVKTPDFMRVICLPLVVHKKTRGVLVLASEDNRPVTHELKRFLYIVSDQLALFLENLYLKNRLHMKQS